MIYAYARVSAKDQNLQRQIAAFSEFGIEKSAFSPKRKAAKTLNGKNINACSKSSKAAICS